MLQELDSGSKALIEDPVLHKYLSRLTGCPGSWQINYQTLDVVADPVGDQLRDGFDTLEELP